MTSPGGPRQLTNQRVMLSQPILGSHRVRRVRWSDSDNIVLGSTANDGTESNGGELGHGLGQTTARDPTPVVFDENDDLLVNNYGTMLRSIRNYEHATKTNQHSFRQACEQNF